MTTATLIVLAKAPVAGRSKTRLTPPCTPEQAAALAQAALRDTCAAVVAVAADVRRVLLLAGEPGPWLPAGFDVIKQCEGDLGQRLAHAFAQVTGPALLIGMDTPQVTARLLERSLATLAKPMVDAVVGAAPDGGFWSIGFNRSVPTAFVDVPMSADDTLHHQRRRLAELGLRVADLSTLRDVDTYADAIAIASRAPGSYFADEFARVSLTTMARS